MEALKAPDDTQAYWVNYYWWGKKLCFTGDDAIYWSTAFANAGWVIKKLGVPGVVLGAYIGWAWGLYAGCGGFCFNASWFGGIWLTCP